MEQKLSSGSVIDGDLIVERNGAVAILTLNRPDRLNAFLHENVAVLHATLVELDQDPAIRAIILTGKGRAFSAGADLRATTAPGTDVCEPTTTRSSGRWQAWARRLSRQ